MGKFKSCGIGLRDRKEVYREGELVAGAVILDVLEPVAVKAVRIYCYGEALTKWTNFASRDIDNDVVGREKYFGQVVTLFGRKQNENGPNMELEAKSYRWSFSFRLPPNHLPSSFEGEYGAIRWWLLVEVDKPFPSINNKWYRSFTVLSNLNLNEAVYKAPMKTACEKTLSKALGIGNAGKLSLSISTDRFGYCPGESVALTVVAKNESTKDLGKISASLLQQVVFTANNDTQVTKFGVTNTETEAPILQGETMTISNLLLPIPAVPPSTRKRTCHIISVTYQIKVIVHIPWGINLEASVPIAIGTIPIGKSATPPKTQGATHEIDARSAITFTRCVLGFKPFHLSQDHFPNFPCAIMCPYVSDYVFNPSSFTDTPTQTARTKAAPATSLAAGAAAASTPAKTSTPARTAGLPTPNSTGSATLINPSAAQPGAAQTRVAAKQLETRTQPGPQTLPSAPPIDFQAPLEYPEAPPSYEDVLKMTETELRATTNNEQVAGAKPELKGEPCALLLIRFPDTELANFRSCVQREQSNLADAGGQIAALAAQPVPGVRELNDQWPLRTAIAMFVFQEMEKGKEWFRHLTADDRTGQDVWLEKSDAVIINGTWHGHQDRAVYSLTTVRPNDGIKRKDIQAYTKEIAPLMKEIRERHEQVRLTLASKNYNMLSGQWIASPETLTISRWSKLTAYVKYTNEFTTGVGLQVYTEFRKLFVSKGLVFFSEDLSTLTTQSATNQENDDAVNGDSDDYSDNSNDSNSAENLLPAQIESS